MLRTILRAASFHRRTSIQYGLLSHYRTGPQNVGISLVKKDYEQEEDCLFKTFKNFNVETKDRMHSFEVPCDSVIRFIKLGAINKPIAVQYCHYIAHLSRTSNSPEDAAFYGDRCMDLLKFLLRNEKELPVISIANLFSDISDLSESNCKAIYSSIIERKNLDTFRTKEFSQLLRACYKFGLFNEVNQLFDISPDKLITFRLGDPIVEGVIAASETYSQAGRDSSTGKNIRAQLVANLQKICRRFSKNRVQFITRHTSDFIKSLRKLDFDVAVNPTIKMSGRCTNCDTTVPLFDSNLVPSINNSISEIIMQGSERGIYLNTSPNDVNRFESFLRDIHNKDKRPIDCVIDGLNISYLAAVKYERKMLPMSEEVTRSYRAVNSESQAHVLINAIIRGDLLNRFKKILVVGKLHMTKWPGLMSFFEKHGIHFYCSYNNSKDDLFQLFASTLSPKTLLITDDFLRDHLASLEEPQRIALERWIDTHQVWICNKSLKPIWPTFYEKIVSFDQERDRFHLPVIDFNRLDKVGQNEPPPHLNSKSLTWLCFDTKIKSSNI